MYDETEPLLRLTVVELDAVALVTIAGEIDASNAAELRSCVEQLAARGYASVTLDFTGLEFIDSSGLGALVALHEHQRTAGGRLALRSVTPSLERLLKITGLADELLRD